MRATARIALIPLLLALLMGPADADFLGKLKDSLTQFNQKLGIGNDAITTSVKDATGEVPYLDGFSPLQTGSIFSLSKDDQGRFLIRPGAYTGDFQSYCLHAGTYAPTHGNGYVTAPLRGPKAYLIGRLLAKSADHPEIPQQQVQSLIWAIEAHATIQGDMTKTAFRLLSGKNGVPSANDLLELSGGVLRLVPANQLQGVLQKLSAVEAPVFLADSGIRQIAQLGGSYADMEHLAVLRGDPPPDKNDREIPGGRWVYSPSGVFLSFAPSGYQRTQMEAYCPERFTVRYDASGCIRQIESADHSYRLVTAYQDAPAAEATAAPGLQEHSLSALALLHNGRMVFHTPLTGSVLTGIPTDANSPAGTGALSDTAMAHYQQIQDMQRQFIGDKPRTMTGLVVNLANYRDGLSAALATIPNDKMRSSIEDMVARAWMSTAYEWINEDKGPVHTSLRFVEPDVLSDQPASLLLAEATPPAIPLTEASVGEIALTQPKNATASALPLDMNGMVITPGETGRQRLGVSSRPVDDGGGNGGSGGGTGNGNQPGTSPPVPDTANPPPDVLPVITSIKPESGPVGTSVTITGTGFTGTVTVAFNGTPAKDVNVQDATTVIATVPYYARSGSISITTSCGIAHSSDTFNLILPLDLQEQAQTYFSDPNVEGVWHTAYRDSTAEGYVTIGIGHMVSNAARFENIPFTNQDGTPVDVATLQNYWDRLQQAPVAHLASYYTPLADGLSISDVVIANLFNSDYNTTLHGVALNFSQPDDYIGLPEPALIGLMDLQYSTKRGLSGFPSLMKAVKAHDWLTAMQQCRVPQHQLERNGLVAGQFYKAYLITK